MVEQKKGLVLENSDYSDIIQHVQEKDITNVL